MFPRSSLACICSAEKLPYTPLPLHLNLSWVYKDCQLIAWRNDDGGDHFEGLWKNWFAKSCEQEDIRWSAALWTKGLCVHHSRGVHRQTGNRSLLQRKPPGLHHQVLNSLPHTCTVSQCPSPLSAPFNGPLWEPVQLTNKRPLLSAVFWKGFRKYGERSRTGLSLVLCSAESRQLHKMYQ